MSMIVALVRGLWKTHHLPLQWREGKKEKENVSVHSREQLTCSLCFLDLQEEAGKNLLKSKIWSNLVMLCAKRAVQLSVSFTPNANWPLTGNDLNGIRYTVGKMKELCCWAEMHIAWPLPVWPDSCQEGPMVISFDEKAFGHSRTWARVKVVSQPRLEMFHPGKIGGKAPHPTRDNP